MCVLKEVDSRLCFLSYLLDELVSCSTGALTLSVTVVGLIRKLQRQYVHANIVYTSF